MNILKDTVIAMAAGALCHGILLFVMWPSLQAEGPVASLLILIPLALGYWASFKVSEEISGDTPTVPHAGAPDLLPILALLLGPVWGGLFYSLLLG